MSDEAVGAKVERIGEEGEARKVDGDTGEIVVVLPLLIAKGTPDVVPAVGRAVKLARTAARPLSTT